MHIEGRHCQIMEQVRGAGRVFVTELAEHFDITPKTIRHGLATLDRNGALRKVHGGAIPAPALPGTGVTQRKQVSPTTRQAVARATLARLAPKSGTTLFIDAGTTAGSLVCLLPGDSGLTVIINSVLTAAWLAGTERTRMRILGGQLRGLTQAAVDPKAVETLFTLRVDVIVPGVSGLGVAHGLSMPDPDEAIVKHAVVHSARQVVALVDSTEIGQEYLISLASLDDIDLLITGVELLPALIDRLTATETEVLVA